MTYSEHWFLNRNKTEIERITGRPDKCRNQEYKGTKPTCIDVVCLDCWNEQRLKQKVKVFKNGIQVVK